MDADYIAALKRELLGYETHGQEDRAAQVREVLESMGEKVERPAAARSEKATRRKA